MSKIALCDVSGLLSNLLSNLSGKNGDEWAEILRRTLRRQNPFALPFMKFKPTFRLETQEHPDVLGEIEKRFGLYPETREVLKNYAAREPHTYDVVLLTARQLGFDDVVKLRHVYVRAEELGLHIFRNADAAVWTFILKLKELEDRATYFAMEPINGEILLIGKLNSTVDILPSRGMLNTSCDPDQLWAFELPRKG